MDAQFQNNNFDPATVSATHSVSSCHHLQDQSCRENRIAATDPATSAKVLASLAHTAIPELLELIGMNPSASMETLGSIASHPRSDVRIAVSENPHLSLEILWRLVGDSNPDVRFALAENHNLPVEILKALTEDNNPFVSCRARRTLERLRNDRLVQATRAAGF